MKIDVVVYNIHSPYIFVDCSQQESYGQLLYSIETLRNHSDIPVLIFSDSKFSLNEFRYIQKHIVTEKFKNVEIYQYEGKESQSQEEMASFCVEKVFEKYNYDTMMYITTNSIINCDPNQAFSELQEPGIFLGKEPYGGFHFLIIDREKSGKYLNDFNYGYKVVSSEILSISVDGEIVKHSTVECMLPTKMVIYDRIQSEYFIPSQYWNCAISDRVRSNPSRICHNCCSIIKNPTVPEVIVYE